MTTKVGLYRDKRNKHRPWVVRWYGEYDPEKGKQRQYSRSFVRKRKFGSKISARPARQEVSSGSE